MLGSEPSGNQWVRLECAYPATDLLIWLSRLDHISRAYWSDREGNFEIAAIGSAWNYYLNSEADIAPGFKKAREMMGKQSNTETKCKCLSYLSFSDSPEQVWPAFGYGRIFLPRIELAKTRQGFVLACNIARNADQSWRQSILETKTILESILEFRLCKFEKLSLGTPAFFPNKMEWSMMIDHVFELFDKGKTSKVVLSRETRHQLKNNMSPWLLMQYWRQANAHSYSFVFEGQKGYSFLGSSPERLIKRQGFLINTEALAGTSTRGGSRYEDLEIEARLMNDSKNINENRMVLDDILLKLKPFCRYLEADRTHSVLKLRNLQHLRYLIKGILYEGVEDEALVMALHPTPAVGGVPRGLARQFIDKNECYSRGLYAGACGIIGLDMTELTVSIRSAQITPDFLSLYSGAGVVRGSSAESEWRELDNKITTIQDILTSLQHTPSCEKVDEVSHQIP